MKLNRFKLYIMIVMNSLLLSLYAFSMEKYDPFAGYEISNQLLAEKQIFRDNYNNLKKYNVEILYNYKENETAFSFFGAFADSILGPSTSQRSIQLIESNKWVNLIEEICNLCDIEKSLSLSEISSMTLLVGAINKIKEHKDQTDDQILLYLLRLVNSHCKKNLREEDIEYFI